MENGDLDMYLYNFNNITFTEMEHLILTRVLDFRIPPTKINKIILRIIWVIYSQLDSHEQISLQKLSLCQTRLWIYFPSRWSRFSTWQSANYPTINLWGLRVIPIFPKPDLCSGLVILEKQDYINKMETILNEASNFVELVLLTFVMKLVEWS